MVAVVGVQAAGEADVPDVPAVAVQLTMSASEPEAVGPE